MRFLILGCNGMAGHMISLYLKERGHDVVGLARKDLGLVKTVVGDITDINLLREVITNRHFDTIVNCVGILNQNAERNKAEAVFINSYIPHFLADIAKEEDSYLIHMSTDCVFSGSRGSYTEEDFKDGTTFYDRTKALGEIEDDKNVTIRSSIVGPDLNPNGIGLLNWFMNQNEPINGFTKAIWTGQTTLQYAKTVEAVAKERIHGIYNLVPDSSISKYELLQLFNHYLRNDKMTINPSSSFICDKSLKCTKFDFDYKVPDYEKMISEMTEWMKRHKELYPHYKLG